MRTAWLLLRAQDALRDRMAGLERYVQARPADCQGIARAGAMPCPSLRCVLARAAQEAAGGAGEAAWPLLLCFLGATALTPALSERALRRGFLPSVQVRAGPPHHGGA